MRITLTKKELKKALKFSKKHGNNPFGDIDLYLSNDSCIGQSVDAKTSDGKKSKDITDYGAW